jgi:hypothetical protein
MMWLGTTMAPLRKCGASPPQNPIETNPASEGCVRLASSAAMNPAARPMPDCTVTMLLLSPPSTCAPPHVLAPARSPGIQGLRLQKMWKPSSWCKLMRNAHGFVNWKSAGEPATGQAARAREACASHAPLNLLGVTAHQVGITAQRPGREVGRVAMVAQVEHPRESRPRCTTARPTWRLHAVRW